MAKPTVSINDLRIASPCPVGWERMFGDERRRFCNLCNLDVYNISEMTGEQVRDLIMNTEGRICARLYHRTDGSVMTRDCPVGLRALKRRVCRAAGAAFAAILSMCSVAFAQSSSRKDQSCDHVSQLRIKRTAPKGEREIFAGVITDEFCGVIPGAKVSLVNEQSKRKLKTSTTDLGEFGFSSLPAGKYTVEVSADGFVTFRLEHLEINSNEVARADISLEVAGRTAVVGIMVATPSIEYSNGTTIIRGDMIQRLPIPE
jgi:hypothetical protein